MGTEDSDLKKQFQQLQQQQQQRLLDRRKKKEDANKKKQDNAPDSAGGKDAASGKFGVADDLGLELSKPSDKGFGYVSEELVDHLNDQIRQMKDENGRLYKLVNEKEFEIRQLKKKGEESKKNTAIDGQVTNETAATKIIELSKRVRELTAEKEAEKTKSRQYQKKCLDLQRQMQSLPPPSEAPSSATGSMISLRSQVDNRDEDRVDVKALQDRLKQSESRLSDFRNQCQQLRQELKVAHKVLSSEIGENVNIQSLLNETSNWRGRAQQIIGLQQKVDELKVQLESASGDVGSMGPEKTGTARRRQDERYRDELRRMEKDRKEAQENAVAKLKTLEAEQENLTNKLDAAKARNKVLSNEIKGQKAQVQTLLKKSRNDDEFVEALLKQQKHLKGLVEEHNLQQAQAQIQQQAQLHQMSMKSQQDQNIVEQLKVIVAQKEAQAKMLELELQHLRMAHAQSQQNGGTSAMSMTEGGFSSQQATPQPLVTVAVDSRPPTASDADTLTGRQRELTNSAMSSARTMSRASSRAASTLGQQQNGSGTFRTNDNNNGFEEKLGELKYQLQELDVMRRAVEVERDKMTELVQVLQDRLTKETEKLTETQSELQGQKRLAVELEKRLGRKSMDGKKKGTARGPSAAGPESDNEEDMTGEINELMARLDIQKDENESLKQALQRTLQAKNEDLKVYSTTLEETKKVFLQALKQMKEKMSAS